MARVGTKHRDWNEVLSELRELAIRSGKKTALARKLDELEAAVSAEIDALNEARRKRIVGPRARVRAATYTVESSPRGPALTELRPGASARPYKVPLPHYRAVASAVASTSEPQTFAEITAAANNLHDGKVPDYAARVSLRLWSALGLVHHEGARFTRVGTKAVYLQGVKAAWVRLGHQPLEVDAAQS